MDWNVSYDYDWRGEDYQGSDVYCYPGDHDSPDDDFEEVETIVEQMAEEGAKKDAEEEAEKYEALAEYERKIFEEESAIVSEIQAEWEKAPVEPEESSEIGWRELDAIEQRACRDWMLQYNKDVGKSLIRWSNPGWTVAKEKAFLMDLYFRATRYDDDIIFTDATYASDALSILGVNI